MEKFQIAELTSPMAEVTEDLTERIRQRAYDLYEAREQRDGNELDDWLLAESEAMQQIERKVCKMRHQRVQCTTVLCTRA
jgi:hypothetical protein